LAYYDSYGGGTYKYYYNGVNFYPVLRQNNYARQTVSSYKTQYRYRDRSKIYTYYHKKVESRESYTSVSSGGSISNVKKFVKYIPA